MILEWHSAGHPLDETIIVGRGELGSCLAMKGKDVSDFNFVGACTGAGLRIMRGSPKYRGRFIPSVLDAHIDEVPHLCPYVFRGVVHVGKCGQLVVFDEDNVFHLNVSVVRPRERSFRVNAPSIFLEDGSHGERDDILSDIISRL